VYWPGNEDVSASASSNGWMDEVMPQVCRETGR
jgi:hypothetical protein